MSIRIFQVTDVEWYAAETGEAAMAALKEANCYVDEDMADLANDGWPEELSDEDMLTHMINVEIWDNPADEAEGRAPRTEHIPFKQELDRMIAAGTEFPCSFACSEY